MSIHSSYLKNKTKTTKNCTPHDYFNIFYSTESVNVEDIIFIISHFWKNFNRLPLAQISYGE